MYVAFLDVKKAFDTVWHEGLMVKMHHKGIRGHLWHIINKCYSSSSSCVLWSGQHSSTFTIMQGVCQGGILSPFLYCIFLDEVLDTLESSSVGVAFTVAHRRMLIIIISLIAAFCTSDDVNQYAKKWSYIHIPPTGL